jgi:hypothetical protein
VGGGTEQVAAGLPVGAAADGAAGRVGRRGVDAGAFEGDGVGDPAVVVLGAQQHGMVGHGGVQRGTVGLAVAPALDGEAAALHPASRRGLGRAGTEPGDGVVEGGGVAERHLGPLEAVQAEVHVRVVEPGEQARAVESNRLGVGRQPRPRLRLVADRQDASAADGERLGLRPRRVEGVDVRTDEQPVAQRIEAGVGIGGGRVRHVGSRRDGAQARRRGSRVRRIRAS